MNGTVGFLVRGIYRGLIMATFLAVAACGGSSGGGSGTQTNTYTISGTISGTPGVSVALSGASSATTTTDSSGNYQFTGLANGSYTITPTLAGETFSPTNLSVTISGANLSAENFTAAATTYTLSGAVQTSNGGALAGVSLQLSGAASATQTSNASGQYSFANLAAGSYTVTPTLAGYTFAPTSAQVTISNTNLSATTFVATPTPPATYSISGTVSGAVAGGVTVTLSGAGTGTTTTAANGSYTFTGLSPGNYTVTPTASGYTFSPTSTAVTINSSDVTGTNFTSTAVVAATYSISGVVSGAVASGVTITLSGAGTGTTTTAANGSYTFTGLAPGNYTVTPSLSGYTFSPTSTPVTITSSNVTGTNFTSSAVVVPTYSISGTVSGTWVSGVTVTLSGASSNATSTAANGTYSFSGLAPGNYTVTPSLNGYTFSPTNAAVTITNANVTGENFSDAATNAGNGAYTISGTLSYAGSKTGLVNVMVFQACSGCNGQSAVYGTAVSLSGSAGAYSGSYTIRGVTPGSYYVIAQVDTLGTGQLNLSNPMGETSLLNVQNANIGANLTLADPGTLTPAAPSRFKVNPANTVGLVLYSPAMTTLASGVQVEADTAYKVYWGTDTAASNGGSQTFAAQGQNKSAFVLTGLPNGPVYFKMAGVVGTTVSTASSVVGPVTIGAPSGGNTVSGTVTFPGTATGPLLVGFSSGSKTVAFEYIANPVSPQAYSVSGVPSGEQMNVVWLDQNHDHVIDAGDLSNFQGLNPVVNVTGNLTSVNETLSNAPEAITLGTSHGSGAGIGDFYSFTVFGGDGTKRAVATTLVSGSNVNVPVDLGPLDSNNQYLPVINSAVAPTVGDAYQFLVTYSDGTSQTITATVTGVLSSFATNLLVNTASPYSTTVPQFIWSTPASPPANYVYFVNVYGSNANWYYPQNSSLGMPPSTTGVVYDVDGNASTPSLTTGTTYNWQITVVDSATGNQATYQTTYTP